MKNSTDLKTLIETGRTIRKKVPRSLHSIWEVPDHRENIIQTLLAAKRHRIPNLVPLLFGRMSASPFAFMRGSAEIMGGDLATTAQTGIHIQICGDCHLGNISAFASPEQRLICDIIDFDETIPGPWEFDVKRLATSFQMLCLQQGSHRDKARDVVLTMLKSYRKRLREFAAMSPLEVWHYIIDSELLLRKAPDHSTRKTIEKFVKKALTHTADAVLDKLIVEEKGKLRFIEDLPLLRRLKKSSSLEKAFRTALQAYPASLDKDQQLLFSHYQLCDLAFKVVGVGSVGTRCGIALFVADNGRRLLLQIKEASRSALEPFVKKSPFAHQGERVVVGQRLMQSTCDLFLGWTRDHDGRDYYVRQLPNMKMDFDMSDLKGEELFNFAEMCGWILARAHAKSGFAPQISGYVGMSDQFDEAIADFSNSYAKQCSIDFKVFKKAIRAGKIPVELEKKK